MNKTLKKFAAGQAVASASDGRIALAVEDGIAVLRGEFTRKDRAPLRFKKGAGWRYHSDESGEWWSLNVRRVESAIEPSVEPKAEPNVESAVEPKAEHPAESSIEVGTIYKRWHSYGSEFFVVTRSTAKSVWLRPLRVQMTFEGTHGQYGTCKPIRQPYGDEFRKVVGESADYLKGGLTVWDGKPIEWNSMD